MAPSRRTTSPSIPGAAPARRSRRRGRRSAALATPAAAAAAARRAGPRRWRRTACSSPDPSDGEAGLGGGVLARRAARGRRRDALRARLLEPDAEEEERPEVAAVIGAAGHVLRDQPRGDLRAEEPFAPDPIGREVRLDERAQLALEPGRQRHAEPGLALVKGLGRQQPAHGALQEALEPEAGHLHTSGKREHEL